jgi:hypothetical protein
MITAALSDHIPSKGSPEWAKSIEIGESDERCCRLSCEEMLRLQSAILDGFAYDEIVTDYHSGSIASYEW